jgi:hypothetical protein
MEALPCNRCLVDLVLATPTADNTGVYGAEFDDGDSRPDVHLALPDKH